ncbi:MAG: hypothetical protein LBR55_03350 [Bacteroidales bacterium]|jgi:hypothetical protein|nr:hypothetical protein [Bacteroidales bacterium]
MKKNILTVAFLLCATFSFAQNLDVRHNILETEVDTVYGKYNKLNFKTIVPKNAISINAGYGIPFISNDESKSEMWHKNTDVALNFGIDYKLQIMQTDIINNEFVKAPSLFGIGVGVGVSYFNQSASMKNHTEKLHNFRDIDGDLCDTVTLSYTGIQESLSLAYVDIPLYLSIGKPSQVKISGYCNIGIKASILVADKFTGEGTYTSSGYYQKIGNSESNVEIFDVEALHYYTDKASYENPDYKLSPFVLWGSLSGGVSIPFSSLEDNKISRLILCLGAKLDYTILPVSKSIAEPYFKGANYRINQSNILGSKGSRMFVPGIDVKLIYCIN